MTEAEWLACDDPGKMLSALKGKRGLARKRRLFVCACCRRAWVLCGAEYRPDIIELAERYADGLAEEKEREAVRRLYSRPDSSDFAPGAPYGTHPQWALYTAFRELLAHTFGFRECYVWEPIASCFDDHQFISGLVREVFGYPLRPPAFAPAWRTPAVVAVARSIYGGRDFKDLPVLADAVEEAGCTNTEVLMHLRGLGPHLRGCWALDLILGKS